MTPESALAVAAAPAPCIAFEYLLSTALAMQFATEAPALAWYELCANELTLQWQSVSTEHYAIGSIVAFGELTQFPKAEAQPWLLALSSVRLYACLYTLLFREVPCAATLNMHSAPAALSDKETRCFVCCSSWSGFTQALT